MPIILELMERYLVNYVHWDPAVTRAWNSAIVWPIITVLILMENRMGCRVIPVHLIQVPTYGQHDAGAIRVIMEILVQVGLGSAYLALKIRTRTTTRFVGAIPGFTGIYTW